MTKKKPVTTPPDFFRETEDLIFALSRQPITAGVTRSPQVDGIIQKCRDYVNAVVMKAAQQGIGEHDGKRQARR